MKNSAARSLFIVAPDAARFNCYLTPLQGARQNGTALDATALLVIGGVVGDVGACRDKTGALFMSAKHGRWFAWAAVALLVGVVSAPADIIILNDGFVLQGKVR